ncbi:MAG: cbb3-type cytochrome oxidase assembly protein CcoS [Rhodanobacter sp.]
MNILLVLIPVTLLVIVVAVALFFWAVNHQQFDDLDSPAVLPLMDEPPSADDSLTAAQPAAHDIDQPNGSS